MKKLAILILTMLFLLTAVSYASFTDVDPTTEAGKAISAMADAGILVGYGNGLFGVNDTLTRAQAVKILNRLFSYTVPANVFFFDVTTDDWFYNDVAIAVGAGYVQGYGDGTFGPNDLLTKEHVCVMLDNIMHFTRLPMTVTLTDPVSDWAKDSVEKLISNRLAMPDASGAFHAAEPISRQNACLLLSQFLNAHSGTAPTAGSTTTGGKTGGGGGGKADDKLSAEEQALNDKLARIITGIREDLAKATDNDAIRSIFLSIADNMERYREDRSYDYTASAAKAQDDYHALPEEERIEARQLLAYFFLDDHYYKDLTDLYEFFF